ncbi:MAG: hypothetical protein AB8D78_11395 [Akkermansiaceae bacterium]
METIYGAPTYSLSSDQVSLHITKEGGQMAPVTFKLNGRTVSPYSISPWNPDEVDGNLPPLLKNLRGDFICLPFGPQENGPPHGDTANADWSLVSKDARSIVLQIDTKDTAAKVTKSISIRDGHTALYLENKIEGLDGHWSYGTHPIIDFSSIPEGTGRLSVSPFSWASVYPEIFSNPADGANQELKIGAIFSDLSEVPLTEGGTTDLTRYPARPATDDLVMMVSKPASDHQPFAWSACLMDGYVWFSLKDPADFPATLFWLSNGGRSAAPWNSRHTSRVGIEEVCSHFCDGVDISRKDLLHNLSIPTTRSFSKDTPVTLRIIQAVAAVPGNFGMVKSIKPDGPENVKITDEHGAEVNVPLGWKFI